MILTTELGSTGRRVLARKRTKSEGYNLGGVYPVTYANRTQAYRKLEEVKAEVPNAYVWGRYPFYVVIPEVN